MHKMNLEEIINYKRPKETYYDILGCSSSSSVSCYSSSDLNSYHATVIIHNSRLC